MEHNLYILEWTEYERGWGQRLKGIQVFLEYSELEKVLIKDSFERRSSKETPSEYSIPTEKMICLINEEDYNKILKIITAYTLNSMWFLTPGERDVTYLIKTYPSLKVISSTGVR